MAKSKAALSVSLEPYDGKDDGLSILAQAMSIEIVDKSSHEIVLADIKRWKEENREIEAFYSNSKKDGLVDKLYSAYTAARDMRDNHLRPRKDAIAAAEKQCGAWVAERKRIELEEADRIRREAEAREQARRDEEARKAEEAALALEASSNVLSEREQRFVAFVVAQGSALAPGSIGTAAMRAGYKDFRNQGLRLMKSAKIQDAIANAQKAAAIRRESEAKQSAPILVEAPQVESQIGKVSGISTRTYYGCAELDGRQLIELARRVVEGSLPAQAIQPNMPFLGEQARSLKENFERVYPMCKLTKRDGVAG